MIVRYTARAITDLGEIEAYITERNPSAARKVGIRLKRSIDGLADFPGMGRETDHPRAVRVLPVGRYPYMIYYRVDAASGEVLILQVRHGTQQPPEPGEL